MVKYAFLSFIFIFHFSAVAESSADCSVPIIVRHHCDMTEDKVQHLIAIQQKLMAERQPCADRYRTPSLPNPEANESENPLRYKDGPVEVNFKGKKFQIKGQF